MMTEPQNQQIPDLPWIEAADNPWGVRLLDVRPITLGLLSTSQEDMKTPLQNFSHARSII
jgi:hypothetical protein